jgi:plastocyanin
MRGLTETLRDWRLATVIVPLWLATSGPAPIPVLVKTFQFGPDTVVVRPGDRVEWRNADAIEHTVTAGTPEQASTAPFEGKLAGAGSTFATRFDRSGTYPYYCARHSFMKGVVVVRAP